MNAEQKELLDLAILRVLDANRTRWGMTVAQLAFHLLRFGFTAASCDCAGDARKFGDPIADRIEYLTNKGLVEEVLKAIGKANRAWRITSEGIDFVDQRS